MIDCPRQELCCGASAAGCAVCQVTYRKCTLDAHEPFHRRVGEGVFHHGGIRNLQLTVPVSVGKEDSRWLGTPLHA